MGILLHEKGWDPLVIERDPELRTEGYMMDFFGTGWDVAERVGIADALRSIKYPVDRIDYVDADGKAYASTPIDRVRRALNNNYVYLRRSDLESILFKRASEAGLDIRFGTSIRSLEDNGSFIGVVFEDGGRDSFSLVFGADGVHSRVRDLVFGPEKQFARFLGAYVAAFHTANKHHIEASLQMFEEVDRLTGYYPISDKMITAFYLFRSQDLGFIPRDRRLLLLKEKFKGSRWIAEKVLDGMAASTPIFLDSLTQILMPAWRKGRIALLGDASGCLTLAAGQGSHMAMAGAYVIANELENSNGNYDTAFKSYEAFMKPFVTRKQDQAARFARTYIPSQHSRMWLRRIVIRLIFSRLLIGYGLSSFGAQSILKHYP